ncbi:matrix Gla protein-like [Arapaima gigas]
MRWKGATEEGRGKEVGERQSRGSGRDERGRIGIKGPTIRIILTKIPTLGEQGFVALFYTSSSSILVQADGMRAVLPCAALCLLLTLCLAYDSHESEESIEDLMVNRQRASAFFKPQRRKTYSNYNSRR